MDTFGLIGYPLGHSFSARYFADKFLSGKIDAEYLNFEIPTIDDLRKVLSNNPNLKGFNVTIPYKQQIIPFLDGLSEEAKNIGAVNVVKVEHNGDDVVLKGYNADVIGFVDSIRPLLKQHHKRALILGTGGASKAVLHGLHSLGLETLYVSRSKKEGMITYDEINGDTLSEYNVIVNCSPCGMFPHVDECPQLPYEIMTERNLLYDLVYNPLETLFMRRGAEHGAVTKNGLEMLHLQAEASWKFWNEN